MSILKKAWKAAKKAVAKVAGVDTSAPKPKEVAQMGPAGDTSSQAARGAIADRRRQRRSRGRDSTIITARSDIGSRTLLG
jgi:hypothetical protein